MIVEQDVMTLRITNVFLAAFTLASLILFYLRWKFARFNPFMIVGVAALLISFIFGFLGEGNLNAFNPDWTPLLSEFVRELFAFIFMLFFAYGYYKMLRMSRLVKEKQKPRGRARVLLNLKMPER
ncbi:MAG: hypothetical protein AB1468_03300 [Candidatus Micrarchaeota archaeon]